MREMKMPQVGDNVLSIDLNTHSAIWTEVVDVFISPTTGDYVVIDSDNDVIKSEYFGISTFYSIEEAEKECGFEVIL